MKKPRTKAAMVDYLSNHFRYDTMGSWNQSTSYAVNIKAHRLGLSRAEEDAVFEMLDVAHSWRASGYDRTLREFDKRYSNCWQIGSNGRSGGYLVLYQGGQKPSEHKSLCHACGQRNFTIASPEPAKCGLCGAMERYTHTFPMESYSYPGKSLDMGEDFSEWPSDDLRNRVDLIWDFDKTCAAAVKAYVQYAMRHRAVEETIMVPTKVMVAKRKTA